MTSIGVLTMHDEPWDVLVDQWRWLEDLGFDSAWTADHFVDPRNPAGDWFEGWTLLAALATRTTKIRLGTLVSSMTLRNPALLARQALTVDHISGGRLDLGVGSAGRTPNDHTMTGVPEWPVGERIARFREFVEVIRHLLRERVTSYQGEHYQVEGAVMAPPPVQQPSPPLVVAAIGPRTMRVAAELGDRWNTFIGARLPWDEVRRVLTDRVAAFDAICVEVGRDPRSVKRSLLAYSVYLPPDLWTSEEVFADVLGFARSVGFDELIFDLPPRELRASVETVVSSVLAAARDGR